MVAVQSFLTALICVRDTNVNVLMVSRWTHTTINAYKSATSCSALQILVVPMLRVPSFAISTNVPAMPAMSSQKKLELAAKLSINVWLVATEQLQKIYAVKTVFA